MSLVSLVLKKNSKISSESGYESCIISDDLDLSINSPPGQIRYLLSVLPHIPRTTICKALGVSRANTYVTPKLDSKDKILANLIATIRVDNPYYGLVRLKLCLQLELNQNHSLNKLRRVCNKYSLKAKSYSKKHLKLRDRGLPDTQIPNLLKALTDNNNANNPGITRPNHVWCSDFTYLRFQGYWYYLATTMDVYTKEILGHHLSTRHNTSLVLTALGTAIYKYGIPEIIHTDQGSEYRSIEYLNYLQNNYILVSNSAKSSPWENGFQESFYGKFKPELEIHKLPYGTTFIDLYNYICNQINYYNKYRIHTTIQDTPAHYRQKFLEENLVYGEVGG